MLADSTVTVSGGTPPFFLPPPTSVAGSAAAAAAATRALIMNPAAYLAAGAAAPFLYGNNALRYRPSHQYQIGLYNKTITSKKTFINYLLVRYDTYLLLSHAIRANCIGTTILRPPRVVAV